MNLSLETEFKFTYDIETDMNHHRSDPKIQSSDFSSKLKSLAESTGAKHLGTANLHLEDIYFDTEKLTLFKTKASIRIRHTNRGVYLTVKTPVSREGGLFKRREFEVVMPPSLTPHSYFDTTLRDILNLKEAKDQLEESQDYISLISNEDILNSRAIVTIVNNRTAIDFQLDNLNFMAIYFDRYTAGRTIDQLLGIEVYEIEIEHMLSDDTARFEQIRKVAQLISSSLQVIPNRQSKYETALKLLELHG